jgi:hypothetical protein
MIDSGDPRRGAGGPGTIQYSAEKLDNTEKFLDQLGEDRKAESV